MVRREAVERPAGVTRRWKERLCTSTAEMPRGSGAGEGEEGLGVGDAEVGEIRVQLARLEAAGFARRSERRGFLERVRQRRLLRVAVNRFRSAKSS